MDHRQKARLADLLTLAAACLLALGLTIYAATAFHLDDTQLRQPRADSFNDGWSALMPEGWTEVAGPVSRALADGGTLTIQNTLPQIETDTQVLFFLVDSEDVTARVGGEVVYTNGLDDRTSFGRYWGGVWCMVPLSPEHSGQTIRLELTSRGNASPRGDAGSYEFRLDERSAVLYDLITDNLFLLGNCLIGLATAASLLLTSIYRRLRRTYDAARLYLALLILLVTVWTFTNANLSQLLFSSKAVGYLLNYTSFFLFGVPFSLLLGELLPRRARRYRRYAYAFAGFFAFAMALYVLDLMQPAQLLPAEHAMMAVIAVDAVACSVRDARDERASHGMLAGVGVFCAIAMAALAWFYIAPRERLLMFSLSDLLMLGIDALVVTFHMAIVRRATLESEEARTFRRQAYTDAMTGAHNRAAFEMRADGSARPARNPLALFMVDLNNLKAVNDSLGHETGDLLIRSLVGALREAFGDEGEIYRYGGDEFVVLMEDADEARARAAQARLAEVIAARNRRGGIAVDVAVGHAVAHVNGGEAVRALLHRADEAMYAAKQRLKAEGAPPAMEGGDLRAQVDPLTGLMTFGAFRQRLLERLGDGGRLAVVSFDVNRFDGYNRLFGWAAGDALLKRLGAMALALCGADGFCAHGYADSFWVLTGFDAPEALYRRIRAQAQRLNGDLGDVRLFLSFGIYVIDDPGLTVSEMCHRAVLAKRAIKGRFDQLISLYDDAGHARQTAHAGLLTYMQAGLAKEEFVPYYQPQWSPDGAKVVGAEALVRWQRPGGFVMPASEFVELFEKSGLMLSLDRYMFERVVRAQRERLDRGLPCPRVAVNLSRLHAFTPGAAERMRAVLDRLQVPPELICVELTETAFAGELDRMSAFVDELRAQDLRVAMDDFGAGLSSLAQLSRLHVDTVKFDRTFLLESFASPFGRTLIESMLQLCRRNGIYTIVEGVERPEQQAFLRKAGCDALQGDLLSPPLPAAKYDALLLAPRAGNPD